MKKEVWKSSIEEISIEEASQDLKLRPSQLENIEEGNKDAFKDIHGMTSVKN